MVIISNPIIRSFENGFIYLYFFGFHKMQDKKVLLYSNIIGGGGVDEGNFKSCMFIFLETKNHFEN